MGTTQLSARESLTETMQKGEFPKLKTSEFLKEEVIKTPVPVEEKTYREETPLWIQINICILIAQLLLFFVTLYLMKSSKPAQKYPEISQKVQNKNTFPKRKVAESNMIADFDNQESLQSIFGTTIGISNDRQSEKILRLEINPENATAREGNSLKIAYSFVEPAPRKASFFFEVPNIDIAHAKGFSFYLKSPPRTDEAAPKISVILTGTNGKQILYQVEDVFSFWKKYTFRFDSEGEKFLEGGLTSIKFELESSQKSEGAFSLDQLTLSD